MKELTKEENFALLRVLTLATLFLDTIAAVTDRESFESVLKNNFKTVPKLYPEGPHQPAKDIVTIMNWSGMTDGDEVAEAIVERLREMEEATDAI